MGEKAKVKETVRLYSKVWQLPTFRGIIARLILYVTVFSTLFGLLRSFHSGIAFFDLLTQYLFTLSIPALIGTTLLYVIIKKKDSPLDLRRSIGVVQYGFLLWLFLGSIGAIIDFVIVGNFFEIRMMLLGLAAAYTLAAFLVTGLSDYSIVRNFISASMLAVTWILAILIIQYLGAIVIPSLPMFWFLVIPMMVIIASSSVHYVFRAVSVPFERDLGINGPALLRAFGHEYLCDNPEPFEALISQIASEQDIPIDVIVFKNEGKLVGVAVTNYVHPGPFRDIGSSGLPSAIMDHIREKYDVPAFVMHGTCTHHQNLTSKEDYVGVMEAIDRLIEETPVAEHASGPHWTDNGKFKAWSLFMENDVLLVTTSAPEFTDDIALEVAQKAIIQARAAIPQVGKVSIADAHNCINGDAVSVMPEDPESETYSLTVAKAIQTTIDSPRRPISIGLYQKKLDNISSKEGIGKGGITAFVMKTGDEKSAFVCVDGNNMEPGLREEIQQMLQKGGFVHIEALTTDTHLVNAISLSSRGYPPVGRHRKEETLQGVLEAVREADKQIVPVNLGMGTTTIKKLRTFGEKGFDTLTQNIVEAWEIVKSVGKDEQ